MMIYLVLVIQIGLIAAIAAEYHYTSVMTEEVTGWVSALAEKMTDQKKLYEKYDRRLTAVEQIAANAQNKATANARRLDRSVIYEAGH